MPSQFKPGDKFRILPPKAGGFKGGDYVKESGRLFADAARDKTVLTVYRVQDNEVIGMSYDFIYSTAKPDWYICSDEIVKVNKPRILIC